MARKIDRRTFLFASSAATAGLWTARSEALTGRAFEKKTLASSLLPAESGHLFDVARNRVAYQSSAIDDDHTAHLVTDGSLDTFWESQPGGEPWINISLGQTRPVSRITIRWGTAVPARFRVEVTAGSAGQGLASSDSWTTVYHGAAGLSGMEQVPLHDVSAGQIRILAEPTSSAASVSIVSFEAWSRDNPNPVPQPFPVVSMGEPELVDGWSLQAAMFTEASPDEISSPHYAAPDWIPAVASATVLTSYLENNSVPAPFYGNQQAQVSDAFFTGNDFWYRNIFRIPSEVSGRRLWLRLDGINWKADVWMNGHRLGHIAGAFLRKGFDITNYAIPGVPNCVAVLIHHVAHPGPVQHKNLAGEYRNGGVLGCDSPTFVASIGWNWLPTIRGRNIGIWNKVRFETTRDVTLSDPWVSTEILSKDCSRAVLALHTEISNHSARTQRCLLRFSSEAFSGSHKVELAPGETKSVTISEHECAGLSIANPRLWWPNGYGEAALHTLYIAADVDGMVSDERRVTFGIRKIEYSTQNNILTIHVNHCRILCRGGNWGMDEGMLRCDAQGYDVRIRMHHDMHLNMIRNWVGMVGRDEFYDACDRYGILVWDDFWMANPVDGPDPTDHAMFIANALDKIRRVRSHASLALYCGRNEGDPPPDIDAALRAAVKELDGSRYYIPNSAAGLVTGHGPYSNQDPDWYFAHRGATFHSEQGIVCVPAAESVRAMMLHADQWPISDTWAIHDYQRPRSELNTERIEQRYGPATSLDDYCRKAQLVNLETAKAIYESLQSRQGSGQLIWMTQAAWPALICQLYDYFFDETAACFGAKTGCRPVHILWDQNTEEIRVTNNTPHALRSLNAEAQILTLDGKTIFQRRASLDVPAASAVTAFALEPQPLKQMSFIKLSLRRSQVEISDNFYWRAASGGDCTSLNTLRRVAVQARARMHKIGSARSICITVANPNKVVALAVRLQVQHGDDGERLLPVLYEDNYFSLVPGESRAISIEIPHGTEVRGYLRLIVDGWNVDRIETSIEMSLHRR